MDRAGNGSLFVAIVPVLLSVLAGVHPRSPLRAGTK